MHEDPADWMGRLMASPDTSTHPFAQAYTNEYNAIRGMSILEVLQQTLLEVGQREHQVLLGVRRQAAAIRKNRIVVLSKDVQATAQRCRDEGRPGGGSHLCVLHINGNGNGTKVHKCGCAPQNTQQLHFSAVHVSAGIEAKRPLDHGPPPAALAEVSPPLEVPPAKIVCRRLELGSGCEALAAGIELNELAGAPDGSSWPSADFAMPLTCCSAAPQPAEGGHRLSLCLSLPSPTPQPPTLVPPPTHIHAHTHAHRHSKESPVNKKRQRGEPGEGPACKKKGSILSPCSEQKKQDMRLACALRTKKEEEKRKEKRARALDKDTTRKKLEQNARTDAFRWDKRVRGDSRPTFNKNGGGFLNTKNMPWSIQNHDASVNCLGHDAPAGFSVRAQKNLMLARQTLPHVPATQQPTPALLARSRLNTQVPSPVELNDDKQSGSTRSRGASVKLSTSVASTDTAMSLDVTCLVKRLCKEILPDEAQGQEHTNFQNVYNRMWPILNSLPWHKDVDMAAISENGMREDVHGLTKTMLTAVEREAASRAAAPIVVDGCTEFYERLPPSLLTNAGAPFSVKTAPSRELVLRPTECQQATVSGLIPPRVVVCSNLTS